MLFVGKMFYLFRVLFFLFVVHFLFDLFKVCAYLMSEPIILYFICPMYVRNLYSATLNIIYDMRTRKLVKTRFY